VFEIVVTGKGGHAAMPQQCIDPTLIASHIVAALQSIASRNTDPAETLVVSVTRFHGGTAHNVIPGSVELGGTIRALSQERLESAQRRMDEIAGSVAAAFGGSVELKTAGAVVGAAESGRVSGKQPQRGRQPLGGRLYQDTRWSCSYSGAGWA